MKKIIGTLLCMSISSFAIDSGKYNCTFEVEDKRVENMVIISLFDNGKAKIEAKVGESYQSQYGQWVDYGDEALILDKRTVLKKEGDIYTMSHGMFKCNKM